MIKTFILICTLLPFALSAKNPNILFIAIDDLKPELGAYGYTQVKSPNIDQLAKSATTFTNAHCQWAVCGPSRASLMTGLYPESTGVMDLKTKMRSINPDVLTLPQHFKNSGYFTAATGKIYDPRCVDGREKDDAASWSIPYKGVNYGKVKLKDGKRFALAPDIADEDLTDGQILLNGLELLKQANEQEKPFFLAVGFKKPHLAFVAPKRYWDLYDRNSLTLPSFREQAQGASPYGWHDSNELRGYDGIPKKGPIPMELQKEAFHGYLACVSYIDTLVGRLIKRLDDLNLRENTIIVLWGDHGFHLGDHNMWGKHTNLEQATRVPLIIYIPGQTANQSSTPAELMDMYPTLCDAAGITTPKIVQGDSLLKVIKGTEKQHQNGAISFFKSKGAKGYSYRTQRYRYIEWIKANKVDAIELYDYEQDPGETLNLATNKDYAALIKELSTQLREDGQGCKLMYKVK
ncbi:sulfatase [Lentisphaera profundi]|uniref:Sulfatase n=1 Tax=Lentisphaera profundi TaxID=1658616 RepID=A0ABY7VX70_9BACT|nr:sulfatase [Lentisphaera profundi]WDE97795.1 sulfatase [Lentisphaera profundi]